MLFFLKSLAFFLGRLPLFLALTAGKGVGRLAYRLDKSHRKRVGENLEKAFPALDEKEKKRIAGKVFENLAMTAFEFTRIPWLKKANLEGYVECEGTGHLRDALARKKGVILFTAHFGNWELMAACYGLAGYPLDIVVRELEKPALEEFVRWTRERSGNKVVYKNRAMRKLLKRLSSNGIVGILLDQNVAHNEGVFVDFFGQPACTNRGPALLAAQSGAAMVPTFIVREDKRHRIIIGPEVELARTKDREADALENTARCTRVIEDMIRRYPEQWFWVHRRWKTRPQG